jgi:tetratricopeptide (TPR) repeat protein
MWPFENTPDVTFRKALACMNRGDYANAAKLFLKVSKQPGTLRADAAFNVAVCLVKAGDFGGGASAYRTFIGVSPDDWSPDLEDYAGMLEQLGRMPLGAAQERHRAYEAAVNRRQESTAFGSRDVPFMAFYNRIVDLARTVYCRGTQTPGLRLDHIQARSRLFYQFPPLSPLPSPAALELCAGYVLWGVAVGHAIRETLGESTFEFRWPADGKIHYSEADVSRSVTVDWVYVRRAVDSIADTLLELLKGKFWSIREEWSEPIRGRLIKELVFLGLGLALQAPAEPVILPPK